MENGGYWNSVFCQVPRSNFTAECQGLKTVARFVAFRGNLSAEIGKRLNSSSRYFTSRAPLFEASYLFAARLLEYKIPTRWIV
jgi:hypothetical protein